MASDPPSPVNGTIQLPSIQWIGTGGGGGSGDHVPQNGASHERPKKTPLRKDRVTLTFSNVSASITSRINSKTTQTEILHNVTAEALPGEILAILGSSGSGKTTLLNVLSGRMSASRLTGTILFNGKKRSKRTKRGLGYVMQDDLFHAGLTVRQALQFTSRLRLPGTMSKIQKQQRVEKIIKRLNILKCADNRIGDVAQRGISGGERKRLSVASEMLIDPALLFLDEPTSGLDSATAMSLVKLLRDLAHEARTIVCTIHQPSSQIFALFDKILLLSEGRVVYYGPRQDVVSYFAAKGFPCSSYYNPADHLMDIISSNRLSNRVTKLEEAWQDHIKTNPCQTIAWNGDVENPPHAGCETDDGNGKSVAQPEARSKWPVSFQEQFLVLLRRSFLASHGEALSGLNTFYIISVALVVGLIWWQLDTRERNIEDRLGAIFFITVFWGFVPLFNALTTFPPERHILNRERASGGYRLSAWFLAKTTSEAPLAMVLPIAFVTITYWMVGLNANAGRFFLSLLTILACVVASQSIGFFIGASVLDFKKSIIVSSLIMLTLMLLGGFYVASESIPPFLRWTRHASVVTHAYGAMLRLDLDGLSFACDEGEHSEAKYGSCPIPGEAVIREVGVTRLSVASSIGILLGMALVLRIGAYLCLRYLHRPAKAIEQSDEE